MVRDFIGASWGLVGSSWVMGIDLLAGVQVSMFVFVVFGAVSSRLSMSRSRMT